MSTTSAGLVNLVLIVAMIAILYFLMIRPQRKRDKQMQEMRDSLTKGDEIVTIGGIIARVDSVKDETIIVTVNSSHTKLEILKTAVGSVRRKSETKKQEEAAPAVSEDTDSRPVSNSKKVTPKKLGGRKAQDDKAE